VPCLAGRLFGRGVNGEGVGQAEDGEYARHVPVRGREDKAASGLSGLLSGVLQGGHAAAIDEGEARQVHDDPRFARGDPRDPGRDSRGVGHVKLSAQRDHGVAVIAAGAHDRAEHGHALLANSSKAGVLTQQLAHLLSP
jgi:hypothetical protein